MKKFFALLLVVLSVIGFAANAESTDSEILFRDIPWGMDAVSFRNLLISEYPDNYSDDYSGEYMKKHSISETNYPAYFNPSHSIFSDTFVAGKLGPFYEIEVSTGNNAKIAGYTDVDIFAYAMPIVEKNEILHSADSSYVYQAGYRISYDLDSESSVIHNDLMNKMTEKYGKPDVDLHFDSSIVDVCLWYGNNDTYVLLLNADFDHGLGGCFSIEYGLSNTVDRLADLIKTYKTIIAPDNSDGL